MKNISKHISYKEAVRSSTATRRGIANHPNEKELRAMKQVALKVFQPVREYFNLPIRINSFFRSSLLNKAIGGAEGSQHTKGEAVDLDAIPSTGLTNKEIFDYIYHNLDYDQLIWEFGDENEPAWIHVSYKTHGEDNRNKAIRAIKKNGKVKYVNY